MSKNKNPFRMGNIITNSHLIYRNQVFIKCARVRSYDLMGKFYTESGKKIQLKDLIDLIDLINFHIELSNR